MGGVVVIEPHAKAGEIFLVVLGNAFNQCFRGNAFLLGTQHNRGAVSIVSTNVVTLLATALLEAYPDIRLDVLKQVA